MYYDIFLDHLQAEPGAEVAVAGLVLAQVVWPHEGFAAEPAHELLQAGVHPLVAGQLVTPDKGNIRPETLC